MPRPTLYPALAAQLLLRRAAAEPVLRLDLPEPAPLPNRREAPPREPDALVLEADGSFTEVRH